MQLLIENQFLPPVKTFALFYKADIIHIEGHENYQKRSYRNRCHILSSQGRSLISIPLVKGKNEKQKITDVKISYDQDWFRVTQNQIKSAYGKSAFFDFYFDELTQILNKKHKYLFELNLDLILLIARNLQLDFSYKITETYLQNYGTNMCDFRSKISPINDTNKDLKDHYTYPQVFEDKFGFTPNLSILDLMFNMGPESSVILKEQAIYKNDYNNA